MSTEPASPDRLATPAAAAATDPAAAGAVLPIDELPFVTLTNWVKAAARCGFNIEPVFRQVGIQTDLIHLESGTIRAAKLGELMAVCVAQSRQQHFPFMLGETFAFEYQPDLETFLTTSPSLREALRIFEWVRRLINPLIDVTVEEEGDQARLLSRLDVPGSGPEVTGHFTEGTFAAVQKFLRVLLGEQHRFTRVDFRHPPLADESRYAEFFDAPVHFRQPQDRLVMERALLDKPLEGAFPTLHRQAAFLVEQRLQKQAAPRGLVAQIEQTFLEQPRILGQGIEAVAERLALHPRTLQRRLQAEGVRFTVLQAQVRFKLAARWLEEGAMSVEDISEQLGFCDRRSFTQAFKRWSGLSPSQFRGKTRPEPG